MRTDQLSKNSFVTKRIDEDNTQPTRSGPQSHTRGFIVRVLVIVPLICLTAAVALGVGIAMSDYERDVPIGAPSAVPESSKKAQTAETSTNGVTTVRPEVSRPPDAISDLPDYPGARLIEYSTGGEGGSSTSVSVQLATTDPFNRVKAFYDKATADNGWALISRVSGVDEIESKLFKNSCVARVLITRTNDGTVLIRLERSKKSS
jgi:hypothetical protein